MASPTHQATFALLKLEAKRVYEIVGVLAKYRLAGWLEHVPLPWIHTLVRRARPGVIEHLTREQRVRLALTELGTTYIKLGQLLSTRPDLVGVELAEELSKLQSNTPANPARVVRSLIRKELGKDPAQLFAHFEGRAFASASIAQVHRAQLQTGEIVAVKVQKRGIREQIEQDISIMSALAALVERYSEELKVYNPIALVEEFRRSIMNELDFAHERRNLEAFTRNFADDPTVRFPRAWPELSSELVLTMDFLDGILGTDIEALQSSGADLGEFARRGATIYLDMIFRDSFYHADPHPGNLFLLADGVVGIIDCGMVGHLDANLHQDFESLMLSVARRDPDLLANTLWRLSEEKPAGGRSHLQADLSNLLADATEVSIEDVDMAAVLRGVTGLVGKYKISLRPALSQLLRTLALLEGTAQRLDPKFSLTEVIDPYCEQLMLQRFSPARIARNLGRSYQDWDRLLTTLPRDIGESLEQLQSGKFQVRINQRHLDGVVNRLVVGIVLAALIVGSSFLWSFKAPPLVRGVSFFGAAGYALALIIGWLLLRSIWRSGKLDPRE